MVKKTDLQKNWDKIWKELQVQLNFLSKEAKVWGKKIENFFKDVSVKGKARTEASVLRGKREWLFYNLGKAAYKSSKGSKKITKLRREIRSLSKEINSLERAAK